MPLTGDELKAKLAELGQVDEATAAIACGYTTKAGKASLGSFRQAQLAAHGLALSKPRGTGRKGRALSYTVAASAKGAIVLASGYAALIGIGPGEQAAIAHHDHQLIITKAGVTPTATAEPVPVELPVVTYDSAPPQATPELCPF